VTVLAALAAIPGRADILPAVLESLRSQVDRLCVYLNGWDSVPECVRDLADEHVLSAENEGAERKLWWAPEHEGIYLSCDDDFCYPPDYAATMSAAVGRFGGQAIVTAHGRQYRERASTVHDVVPGSVGMYYRNVRERWVNYGGTGVMAWDAGKVRVPRYWQHRNMLDAQLSAWANRSQIPMWLIRHEGHWLETYRPLDPQGIFRSSQREQHRRRSAIIAEHGRTHGWRLYRAAEQ